MCLLWLTACLMKVTTTQRIILVEPQQIETTPVHDIMNISFILTDGDKGIPVSDAIILFSCVTPYRNIEGFYTLVEDYAGHYTISVDTDILVTAPTELGSFIFQLGIQWNPLNSPFS